MAYADIRCQRGVAVFGASADSVTVSFGSSVTVSRALVRITSVTYSSGGPDATTTGNRFNDDLGVYIDQSSVTTTGFDLVRLAAGVDEDVRVHWEVWEYVGEAGGPWEFAVIARANKRLNPAVFTGSTSISGLSSDYSKVVAIGTGVTSGATGASWGDASVALGIDTTGGSELITAQRSVAASTTNVTYCAVDFLGSAWSVEAVSHSFSAAGSDETETIADVGAWDQAFIVSTYRCSGAGLDEAACNVWPGSTTTSVRFRLRSGASTSLAAVEAFVVGASSGVAVEHQDSITGGGTDHQTADFTTSLTLSTSVDLERAGMVATSDCAGTGTAYPRQCWGYRLTGATGAEFWRGRAGQPGDWAAQVVRFIGVSGSGSSTLASLTSAGTGTVGATITGTGASTLAALTSAGSGVAFSVVAGTGASTLPALSSSGTGTAFSVVTGSGSSALPPLTSAGTGTAYTVVTGSGASTLLALSSIGSGSVVTPSTHTFDLASYLPSDHVAAWDVGWYGHPDAGDAGYGNWDLSGEAWNASDPVAYPQVPYVTQDASLCAPYFGLGRHRQIASKLRPLPGIYSSSDDDKHDLDLEAVRRTGDPRGRITTWIQAVASPFAATEAGGAAVGSADYSLAIDMRWKSLAHKLARAEAAGLECVTVGYNPLSLWLFYDEDYPTKAEKLAAMQADLEEIVAQLLASSAAYAVNGRLLLYVFTTDTVVLLTAGEWSVLLDAVRASTGEDFYAITNNKDGTAWSWADGSQPWAGFVEWSNSSGVTERLRAYDWTERRHDDLLATVGSYPGRVVIGAHFAGFHDWAQDFGAGTEREIPRTEAVQQGQADYWIATSAIKGLILGTWNDYPEGHCFEPDVLDEGLQLRWATEQIGRWQGETVLEAETVALLQPWLDWEDPRVCPSVALARGDAHASVQVAGAISGPAQVGVAATIKDTAGAASAAQTSGVAATIKPAGQAGTRA